MVAASAWHVSWDQFHRDCRQLATRLAGYPPFAGLVAVTRGGLIPTGIIARELGVRVVETISVASYHAEQARGRLELLKDVSPAVRADGGSGFLVVDDLADTGATARFLRAHLPHAHFAAVYAKPQGRPLLDTYVEEVSQDTWIYFPWDLDLAFQAPLVARESQA